MRVRLLPRTSCRVTASLLLLAGLVRPVAAQQEQCHSPRAALLGEQITFIGQDLPPFRAAYSGSMSLVSTGDHQLSQSYGIYGGACLARHLAAYVDAEMIRGSGISHASGLAAVTNGDVLRQGSVDLGSGPYVARAFVRWTIPIGAEPAPAKPLVAAADGDRVGTEVDTIAAGMDNMPGTISGHRVEITAGKLAATDLFDLNRYANSTRTQFLDWVLFNNGAWDYAADTRGYSNGVAVAWITPRWAIRAGSFQMPTFANGNVFDGDIANARGDNVELTWTSSSHAVVRLLAYENHGRMGRYAVVDAAAGASGTKPNIVTDDAPGRIKYGFGLNAELPLADDGNTGVFARLGWDDGRTESFVFTEVDTHASAGAQISGRRWRRANDVLGIAVVGDGLSGPHRDYLVLGGNGFLLGDGTLRYGPEMLSEAYYAVQLGPHLVLSPDVMLIVHPGYNRDRGPATVLSFRLRVSN